MEQLVWAVRNSKQPHRVEALAFLFVGDVMRYGIFGFLGQSRRPQKARRSLAKTTLQIEGLDRRDLLSATPLSTVGGLVFVKETSPLRDDVVVDGRIITAENYDYEIDKALQDLTGEVNSSEGYIRIKKLNSG